MDIPLQKDVVLSKHYIAAIAVLTALSVCVVWLRMYSRIFVSHNLWWDDWTMFAASVRMRSFFTNDDGTPLIGSSLSPSRLIPS